MELLDYEKLYSETHCPTNVCSNNGERAVRMQHLNILDLILFEHANAGDIFCLFCYNPGPQQILITIQSVFSRE